MALNTQNPLAFTNAGIEANRLAGLAAIKKNKRDKLGNKAQAMIDRHKSVDTRNSIFKIVAFCAALAWFIATVAEYYVSRSMYAVILSTEPNSLRPSLMAAAFGFYAVLLSATYAEFIHPTFAKTDQSYSGFPYLESILKWKNGQTDSRLIWAAIGTILTLATTYFLFAISKERVALEAIVNGMGKNQESFIEVLIPPVLFLIEVITGIFLPFAIYMIYFSVSAKILSKLYDIVSRRYEDLANRTVNFWTAYVLELHRHNNLIPQNKEKQLPTTIDLREILASRFGKETGPDDDDGGGGPGGPPGGGGVGSPDDINDNNNFDNTRL